MAMKWRPYLKRQSLMAILLIFIGLSRPVSSALSWNEFSDLTDTFGISPTPMPFLALQDSDRVFFRCFDQTSSERPKVEAPWPPLSVTPTGRFERINRLQRNFRINQPGLERLFAREFCQTENGILRDATGCDGPISRAEIYAELPPGHKLILMSVACSR